LLLLIEASLDELGPVVWIDTLSDPPKKPAGTPEPFVRFILVELEAWLSALPLRALPALVLESTVASPLEAN
jgi:hypothetical protein